MGTANITLTRVENRAVAGAVMPVPRSVPIASEEFTTDVTSKETTAVSTSEWFREIWIITALTDAVWVSFGTAPDALTDLHYTIPAGTTREFSPVAGNEKAAVTLAQ